uniref:Cation transporter HKT6 n=1 Tax=Nelumbo nucifera TaxID=4432 RepID=A0A822ZRU8_NELNU|nr:TPA_asm: hypothetical protein HUJ06_004375 [Nelumbo nucifera]
MRNYICIRKKLHLRSFPCIKAASFCRTCSSLMQCLYQFLVVIIHANPLWIQIFYVVSNSFLGFFVLKILKPRPDAARPQDLDVFFTSVSAATVSSMSTVEMEVFSNAQLVVLTVLMLLGGEVFFSMLGLQIARSKFMKQEKIENKIDPLASSDYLSYSSTDPTNVDNQIELGLVKVPHFEREKPSTIDEDLKYNSVRYPSYVVSGYLLVIHVCGYALVSLYLSLVPSAGDVLENKSIQMQTFAVFTIVSTFANCVFRKNSGLLLLLIPQVLLGNTLFPSCLRFVIWVLGTFTKRVEFNYILKNTREIGYTHLLPSLHSSLLVVTVFGFILIQLLLFCSMEWNSEGLNGMNPYQKLVGSLFQTVNSRHAGESIFDLSVVSPAILILFVVMMYLPPYTSFLPIKDDEDQPPRSSEKKTKSRWRRLMENLIFSQLSYLVIFVILICISERKKMKEDPLNFTVYFLFTPYNYFF